MSDNTEDHYQGALLEDMNDKLRGIAEAVGGLSDRVERMGKRLERVEHNTETLPALKGALTSISADVDDHEARLKRLEQRAA
jgi:hypothetical protein